AALEAAARGLVDELAPALGFDSGALELVRVKSLAHLAAAGTTPKTVVKFRQVVGGVPVHQAAVNVVFDGQGRVLALDNAALPHVAQAPVVPDVSEAAALDAALAAFAAETGFAARSFERGGYVLFPAQLVPGKPLLRPAAAYVFKLDAGLDRSTGVTPVIRSYAVAAVGQPRVLGSWSHVHNADLTGTVNGWGQVGLDADGNGPDVLHALKDVRLTGSGVPTTYTNDAGGFTIPGVASPTTLTATFNGLYSRVVNQAGAEASIALSVTPGVPATFTFNAGLAEQTTAEVNAHHFAEGFRDWLRSIDPSETAFDFQQTENVNIGSTCNAYYDGVSTNYYLAGGGCPNTAYSTVVWHEIGHWANDIYGTFNGSDGMGEGAADCWAMYIADDPIVAKDFFGPGTWIRTGNNTKAFCGDANPGCYGQVHADGEPLMGAIWKVRANLKSALGSAAGGDVADHLLVGWFQAFNDSQIKSVIEEHWLVLDDDDANIDNGTPHYPQIDAGFTAQAFPGFDLPLFSFQHVPLTSVNSELAVPIQATVTEENGTLGTVTLNWSNDGGANWNAVAMAPLGGDLWKGFVPGQVSPKTVRYWLQASGPGGSNNWPKDAPAASFQYDVGALTTHVSYDFEPVSDEGWTHAQVLTQDDWHHSITYGKAGDPPAAYSGSKLWGNDLGPEGWNGLYKPSVNNYLLSPVFNFSGKTNLRLRFQRWLQVEEAIYDQAELFVNATRIFVNQQNGHHVDTAWTAVDYDIGAQANNNAAVQFKFELTSDAGLEFGGWNIDDFRVVSLGPVTPTAFTPYGTGTPGTGGQTPVLSGSGTASPGGTVTLAVANAKANATGALFVGVAQASIPFAGGTFLVASPFIQVALGTGPAGTAVAAGAIPADANMFGIEVFQQYWCLDAGAAQGKAGSNGLKFTIQ
ncbi:MAG: hypothetical protein FJ296_02415, partial [Planctomycetes bacterium]|nr:hypothetical protein [Planctomycetota bacterium]